MGDFPFKRCNSVAGSRQGDGIHELVPEGPFEEVVQPGAAAFLIQETTDVSLVGSDLEGQFTDVQSMSLHVLFDPRGDTLATRGIPVIFDHEPASRFHQIAPRDTGSQRRSAA
jgi:hypothetical protein